MFSMSVAFISLRPFSRLKESCLSSRKARRMKRLWYLGRGSMVFATTMDDLDQIIQSNSFLLPSGFRLSPILSVEHFFAPMGV